MQDSHGNPEDSKEYKAAVARVRQAVSVQKAVGFMDASRPAKYAVDSDRKVCFCMRHVMASKHVLACRAIVELKQALVANGLARGPLLHSRHSKEDVSSSQTCMLEAVIMLTCDC